MPSALADPSWLLLAVALAALAALRLAGARTYGGSFGRGAFTGVGAEADLRIRGARKPTRWIDSAERLQIERVLRESLAENDAELVVAVAARSRAYPEAGWRLGLLLALVAALAVTALAPSRPLQLLLAAQISGLTLGHARCLLGPLQRLFLSKRRLKDAARARAWRLFAESGLVRSPDAMGMLVLVSLFERRMVVLLGEGLAAGLGAGESAAELAPPIAQAFGEGPRAGAAAAAALTARLCPLPRDAARTRPAPVMLLDLPD